MLNQRRTLMRSITDQQRQQKREAGRLGGAVTKARFPGATISAPGRKAFLATFDNYPDPATAKSMYFKMLGSRPKTRYVRKPRKDSEQ